MLIIGLNLKECSLSASMADNLRQGIGAKCHPMIKDRFMNKEEAAKELGISVRSLQRAQKEGKIRVAYQRGDSGKMEAVYDADEVARYKRVLHERVETSAPDGAQVLALTTRDAAVTQFVARVAEQLTRSRAERDAMSLSHKLMLSLPEAAALSGISVEKLRADVHSRKLKTIKGVGGGLGKVKRNDLEAYVKKL
jgi:hypothetical protein